MRSMPSSFLKEFLMKSDKNVTNIPAVSWQCGAMMPAYFEDKTRLDYWSRKVTSTQHWRVRIRFVEAVDVQTLLSWLGT